MTNAISWLDLRDGTTGSFLLPVRNVRVPFLTCDQYLGRQRRYEIMTRLTVMIRKSQACRCIRKLRGFLSSRNLVVVIARECISKMSKRTLSDKRVCNVFSHLEGDTRKHSLLHNSETPFSACQSNISADLSANEQHFLVCVWLNLEPVRANHHRQSACSFSAYNHRKFSPFGYIAGETVVIDSWCKALSYNLRV